MLWPAARTRTAASTPLAPGVVEVAVRLKAAQQFKDRIGLTGREVPPHAIRQAAAGHGISLPTGDHRRNAQTALH
jgi:hypothetical protein